MGKARQAALDYIANNGGTLTSAVSSRTWPGDAALDVSMISWIKGDAQGPFQLIIGDQSFLLGLIPTHLQLHTDLGGAKALKANEEGSSMGAILGHEAFRSEGDLAFPLEEVRGKPFVHPVATGDDMLRGRLTTHPVFMIDLEVNNEREAAAVGGAAFEHLRRYVYPDIKTRAGSEGRTQHYERWLRTWWQPLDPRRAFRASVSSMSRMIVCASVQERPIFEFISARYVPTNTMQVFAFEDDYSFGVIQSSQHWTWVKANGGKVTARSRYTSDVWKTFPWPQEPTLKAVANVAAAARNLRSVRQDLMKENGWSLRALYQAAVVEGPHPLKDAQTALETAVAEAYGMPADQSPTEFLLELNQLVAEDEERDRKIQGPGIPANLDPKDPRWTGTDCIAPPAVEK